MDSSSLLQGVASLGGDEFGFCAWTDLGMLSAVKVHFRQTQSLPRTAPLSAVRMDKSQLLNARLAAFVLK